MSTITIVRKRPSLVVAAVLLLLLASSAVAMSAPTLKPVGGLTLHDAHGRLVGTVLQHRDFAGDVVYVAFKAGTRLIALGADRNRLMETASTVGTPLYYTSEDCSGQPYEAHNANELPYMPGSFFATDVFMSGGKLYVATGPAQTIQVNSQGEETTGECSPQPSFEQFSFPLALFSDLSQFQPPFSIRGLTTD